MVKFYIFREEQHICEKVLVKINTKFPRRDSKLWWCAALIISFLWKKLLRECSPLHSSVHVLILPLSMANKSSSLPIWVFFCYRMNQEWTNKMCPFGNLQKKKWFDVIFFFKKKSDRACILQMKLSYHLLEKCDILGIPLHPGSSL